MKRKKNGPPATDLPLTRFIGYAIMWKGEPVKTNLGKGGTAKIYTNASTAWVAAKRSWLGQILVSTGLGLWEAEGEPVTVSPVYARR